MIDYDKLKGIFPKGLPEAHNAFATVASNLSYQKLRDEVGNAPTNRRVWLWFAKKYAEKTKDIPVGAVVITGAPTTLDFTKTAQLSAIVAPDNATNKTVTWTTNNANLATVSSTGLVTAKSTAGTVVITATAGGVSKTASIVIKAADVAVASIAVSPKTVTVAAGGTTKLSVTVSPSNATNKSVTFTSADTNKATVTSDGTVSIKSGVGATTVVITAKSVDGGKTDTATITTTAS